jgi:hypothetical protein
MALHAAFDSAGEDWCALYASGSDAPNLFGTTGLDTSALERRALGAGAAVSAGTAFTRYSDDRAKYGKGRIVLDTGTTLSVRANIGYDGVTFDYSAGAPTTLTGVVWVRLQTGTSASTFRLDVAGPGANVTTGAAVTLTTTWQRLATTHTWAVGTGGVYLEVRRASGTDDINVEIAGAMLVAGSSGPTYMNGGADTLAGVLTSYWNGGKWGLGFVKPYQYVAPVGKAELILNNHDKRFSPEYASGPLYGMLLPNALVQIGDPNYGIWWTGWADSWAPEPGANRDKKAKLVATDARRFLSKKLPVLPLFSIETPNVTIPSIIDFFDVPNTTGGLPTASVAGLAWDSINTGVIVDDYADNVPFDHDAVKVLGDILGSIQGKLWCTREGGVAYTEGQGDDTPASYIDLAQKWLDCGYETGQIINQVEVIGHKRKSQSGGSYDVWELDETITLAAGATDAFRVFFKHSNTTRILVGAANLSTSGTLTVGTFGTHITGVLTEVGAQSALLTLTNASGISRTLETCVVTATERVSQLREISVVREDSASITANGTLGERLDFSYTQYREWARRLANYRIARFKDARYEIPWAELDVDVNPSEAYGCKVGAAVHIEDDQTGHDDYYAVIGAVHTVRDGRTDHTVKLYLEQLYPTSVADTSAT